MADTDKKYEIGDVNSPRDKIAHRRDFEAMPQLPNVREKGRRNDTRQRPNPTAARRTKRRKGPAKVGLDPVLDIEFFCFCLPMRLRHDGGCGQSPCFSFLRPAPDKFDSWAANNKPSVPSPNPP